LNIAILIANERRLLRPRIGSFNRAIQEPSVSGRARRFPTHPPSELTGAGTSVVEAKPSVENERIKIIRK
jgi:hypothetical protein